MDINKQLREFLMDDKGYLSIEEARKKLNKRQKTKKNK